METPSLTLNNGLKMPLVGLGTSLKGRGVSQDKLNQELIHAVEYAINVGYRLIDTALQYGTEKEVGCAVNNKIRDGTIKREDIFITTKLPEIFHNPEKIKYGLKKSLQNLQLDYIDLYLIHLPTGIKYVDDNTFYPRDENGMIIMEPYDHLEIWKEMEKLVEEGLVKSIGLSNFNRAQIQNILDHSSIKPANLQTECHGYLMEDKLYEYCQANGITMTAYCPLGSPEWNATKKSTWLPKGHDAKSTDFSILIDDQIVIQTADKHKKSPAQVLLRFLVQSGRAVVPKSIREHRIRENINIFDFQLDDEDMHRMKSINRNLRYYVDDFAPFKNSPDFPLDENGALI